jgi:hypothetical protein
MEGLLNSMLRPGPIALFGSGETSSSGQKIFDRLFKWLPDSPVIAILETPAGFELNSPLVARRVEDFLNHRLQNYLPQTTIIPARRRQTEFSPDDPDIAAQVLNADLIFMGPGSPTYAVRQLEDSLTWRYLVARHRLGTGLAFASAAAIAISSYALPVYEIYKVGDDIHWKPGLEFFAPYGLNLVFVPHWNNKEGGDDLDTSRCFIGQSRFETMVDLLPENVTIVGIDENTGLIFNFEKENCLVVGKGNVTIIQKINNTLISVHDEFSFKLLGDYHDSPNREGIQAEDWEKALSADRFRSKTSIPSAEVKAMVNRREAARIQRNWEEADEIRKRIEALGWQIKDTINGPVVIKES